MRRPDLIYYPDDRPGIARRRAGRGWSYRAPDGTTIDDPAERARIEALAVPPAYEDVWICPRRRGHLQATGLDAARRKQYRYHPDWLAWRSATKFDGLAQFGAALPRLRARVARALRDDPGGRGFAIAALLRLIDRASIRIGSEAYRARTGTEGATTLRKRNLRLERGRIRLDWRAKGGRRVRKQLSDRTLARALHGLADLPGAPLFEWQDETGRHRVQAEHVNDWLREATGLDGATAKTFRTWNGSVAALEAALAAGPAVTISQMSEAAAQRLHNTAAVARAAYIHPDVIALARDWDRPMTPATPSGLRVAERALLDLLAR